MERWYTIKHGDVVTKYYVKRSKTKEEKEFVEDLKKEVAMSKFWEKLDRQYRREMFWKKIKDIFE